MRPPQLRLLLVSRDRSFLSQTSQFLEALGYETLQATGASQAQTALRFKRPDFLVVDENIADGRADDLLQAAEPTTDGEPVYSVLLTDGSDPRRLTAALQAGADDFLTKPVSHGELLARLRAGAGRLAFESRLASQLWLCPVTQLPGVAAFMERRGRSNEAQKNKAPCSCVLFELDYAAGVRERYGVAAMTSLFASAAAVLERLGRPHAEWFFIKRRFAVLLDNFSTVEAAAWADSVRKSFAQEPFSLGETTANVTTSAGVAEGAADGGETLLRRAMHALSAAVESGGNCVVRSEDRADKLRTSSHAKSGALAVEHLWKRAKARDLMTPCTLHLAPNQPASHAAVLFEQTRLDAIPVVDAHDRLVGLVCRDGDADSLRQARGDVASIMNCDPPQTDEATDFAALLELFTQRPDPAVVITRGGRPVGAVHRDSFALLSDPPIREEVAYSGEFDLSLDALAPC